MLFFFFQISDRFFKTKGGGGSHYYGEEPVFERRLPNILVRFYNNYLKQTCENLCC